MSDEKYFLIIQKEKTVNLSTSLKYNTSQYICTEKHEIHRQEISKELADNWTKVELERIK